MLARLTGELRPGDILLLHDGNAARTEDGRPVVLVVLPELLAELERRRLRAVPCRSRPARRRREPSFFGIDNKRRYGRRDIFGVIQLIGPFSL